MSFIRLAVWIAALVAAGTASATSSHAAASDWITTDFSQLRLISAHDSLAGADELAIGIQIRLEEGWKTYWRNPGDAGLPTNFDWSASGNVRDVTLAWPAPKRIPFDGLDSFGYEDEVVFPARVRAADPGLPVRVRVDVAYAVCKDICVPLQAAVTLDIPAEASRDQPGTSAHRALIERYSGRVPSGDGAGVDIVSASVRSSAGKTVLRLKAGARDAFGHPDFFIEGPPDVFFGKPRVTLSGDRRSAVVDIPIDDMGQSPYRAQPLTITLVDGPRAVERTLVPARE